MKKENKLKSLELFELVLEINLTTEREVFFEFIPHVQKYYFSVHKKGWKHCINEDLKMELVKEFTEPQTDNYVYSFYYDNEDFENNLKFIKKLLKELLNV